MKTLFNILTLDNMPGFIEKNKVPFNSVNNLFANRHLYLDFENMKEKRSIVHAISLVVFYLKIIVMILRLHRKMVIPGLS